jgi:hypothetical protein
VMHQRLCLDERAIVERLLQRIEGQGPIAFNLEKFS